MSDRQFVDWIRGLVEYLRKGGELTDALHDELTSMQDRISALYESYESGETPDVATTLKDLMLEALQLMHDGLEDLLEYAEEPREEILHSALAALEEGNDILDSLRYTIEQDTSWTSSAAMG